jgi:hypothetical protein
MNSWQSSTHTVTHCAHNSWWLVLGWEDKADHSRLRFIASYVIDIRRGVVLPVRCVGVCKCAYNVVELECVA